MRGVGPSLAVVETVDSAKLADKLQAACAALSPRRPTPLGVMIQVNTSPWEGTKGGVAMEDVTALATHITAKCAALRLDGLMTIGAPNEPKCFRSLRECRDSLATTLAIPTESLALSMGMSNDFEEAVKQGSSSVRVGSSIFGGRLLYAASKPK